MVYTVFDIETTGLNTYKDDILSFGFIRFNSDFEILASDTLYFYKQGYNVEHNKASEVHGLTEKFLKQYKDEFNDNATRMYAICYNSVLIGKNSDAFDIPFVTNFFLKNIDSLPKLVIKSSYDLQTHFKNYYKDKTGSTRAGKLGEYAELLGITKEDIDAVYNSLPTKDNASIHLHGALYDSVVTFMVFKEYAKIADIKI